MYVLLPSYNILAFVDRISLDIALENFIIAFELVLLDFVPIPIAVPFFGREPIIIF